VQQRFALVHSLFGCAHPNCGASVGHGAEQLGESGAVMKLRANLHGATISLLRWSLAATCL